MKKEKKPGLVLHESRVGKTKRDRESGARQRNRDNKAARAAWQHNANAAQSNFPYETCNGQRNRYWVVRKGERRHVVVKGM